jgi:hypothetical protein
MSGSPIPLIPPGGFEGLFLVAIVLEMGYQPVLEPHHYRQLRLRLDSAHLCEAPGRPKCEHAVSEIAHVRAVNLEGVELLSVVRKEPPHPIVSARVASFQGDDLGLESDLMVHEPKNARNVSAVDRLEHFLKRLDVLLRHRQCSISLRATALHGGVAGGT